MKSDTAKRNKGNIIRYSILTILVMIAIFIFSGQNGDDSGNLSDSFLISFLGQILEKILPPLTNKGFDYDIRKYAHMFEYLCLGISMSMLLREIFIIKRFLAYLLAEIGCFVYACLDEFHQTFVSERVGSFQDVGIDAVGFSIGVLTIGITEWIIYMMWRKKNDLRRN